MSISFSWLPRRYQRRAKVRRKLNIIDYTPEFNEEPTPDRTLLCHVLHRAVLDAYGGKASYESWLQDQEERFKHDARKWLGLYDLDPELDEYEKLYPYTFSWICLQLDITDSFKADIRAALIKKIKEIDEEEERKKKEEEEEKEKCNFN